jgi:hypothetical protein
VTGAWLKGLDLDTFEVERVHLSPGVTRWWVTQAGLPLARGAEARPGAVPLVQAGGRWSVELPPGPSRQVEAPRPLAHGDVLHLPGRAVVFLEMPEAPPSEAERRLLEARDDPEAVRVWADWLLEHGDPLGHHLLGHPGAPPVLEGLEPLVAQQALELTWRNGLIESATFRCTEGASWVDHLPLLRFLSLRVARWTRQLTIDLLPWGGAPTSRLEQHAAIALRLLLTGPHLPCLEHLSFGQPEFAAPQSSQLSVLFGRLPARFPRLATHPERLPRPAQAAWLEVVSVPEGFDFYSPMARGNRLPLRDGLWAGGSTDAVLRVLSVGERREGMHNLFVVPGTPPRWRLLPLSPGLVLNGHPAVATRLLPGDELREPHGVVFRFGLD